MKEPTFSTLYFHSSSNRLYLFPVKVPPGEKVELLELGEELGTNDTLRWIADYIVKTENRDLRVMYEGHEIYPRATDVPEQGHWYPSFHVMYHDGRSVHQIKPQYKPEIICNSEAEALSRAIALGIKAVDSLVG